MRIHATLGECALADNGVEVREWWDIGGSFTFPTYEISDGMWRGLAKDTIDDDAYQMWLDGLSAGRREMS